MLKISPLSANSRATPKVPESLKKRHLFDINIKAYIILFSLHTSNSCHELSRLKYIYSINLGWTGPSYAIWVNSWRNAPISAPITAPSLSLRDRYRPIVRTLAKAKVFSTISSPILLIMSSRSKKVLTTGITRLPFAFLCASVFVIILR
jgi:hypothetical protein